MGVLTHVQNFGGGTAPLKFGKAKNVQNLARFRAAFNFDRKYLQKGLRYWQAVNGVINHSFSRVEPKKSGGYWEQIKCQTLVRAYIFYFCLFTSALIQH